MITREYKKLAYERAVLLAAARLVQERFLTAEGAMSPEQTIECEDLPRADSVVPEESVMDVVVRLRGLAERRGTELRKYKLVVSKDEVDDEQEWEETGEQEEGAGEDRREEPARASEPRAHQGGGGNRKAAAGNGKSKPSNPGRPNPAVRPPKPAHRGS